MTKHYGSGRTAVRALDCVNLDIPGGQFTAIMGPSGSGKSTLMQCLAGLDTIDAGTIRVAMSWSNQSASGFRPARVSGRVVLWDRETKEG